MSFALFAQAFPMYESTRRVHKPAGINQQSNPLSEGSA